MYRRIGEISATLRCARHHFQRAGDHIPGSDTFPQDDIRHSAPLQRPAGCPTPLLYAENPENEAGEDQI
jgi:hypothetical protein